MAVKSKNMSEISIEEEEILGNVQGALTGT